MSNNRKKPWLAALVIVPVVLSSCSRKPSPTSSPDIFAPELGIQLGAGWHELETQAGQRFRWVNNDAEIVVKSPPRAPRALGLELEPGPGLGSRPFVLSLLDARGRRVQALEISQHQVVNLRLPLEGKQDTVYKLHVEGGGQPVPNDPRILNFRVFQISAARPDAKSGIVESQEELRLGEGWYELEKWRGETFRWVNNDAAITARAAQAGDYKLALELEPGPGVDSKAFLLKVLDSGGHQVEAVEVRKRVTVELHLPLAASEASTFRLHISGGGKKIPSDPRILNFRVFRIGFAD